MYGVIYKVTNTVNGNFYIGQTKTTLSRRWSKHCSDARSGAGWILADAIRKHGAGVFVKEILEECVDKDALNAAEVRWIADLKPVYNACAGGGGLGAPTEEVRQKISLAMKGKKLSPETLVRMSAAQKGHPVSEETKRKIFEATAWYRAALKEMRESQPKRKKTYAYKSPLQELYDAAGVTSKQEKIAFAAKRGFELGTRQRLVGELNPMYGQQKSEEIKQKLSEMSRGENNPYYGKKHSEEAVAKMRAAHAARPPVTCPHCGVEGRSNTMKRWHFDNCRSKA
jgi:group I intron endonuclease